MAKELPEKWFMVCNEVNQDVMNVWRRGYCQSWINHTVAIGHTFVSHNPNDGSMFVMTSLPYRGENQYSDYKEIKFEDYWKHFKS